MSARGLVAVTGATGFLGPHVLMALAARGWRLRVLVRRPVRLPDLKEPTEAVLGDLADRAALRHLVTGADAIVHLAGLIKARRPDDFFKANAVGTEQLADAWHDTAPNARFVLVSSMAAREPDLSPYGASKRAGEARLSERAAPGGHVILRPGAVYGPGDRETLALFRAARLPLQPILGRPGARLALIHAADVASAVPAAAEADSAGALWELTDRRPEGYAWPEIIAIVAGALGRRARPVPIPAPLLTALGQAGDAASWLTGGARMLTSHKVREILHLDWSSSPDRLPPPEIWRPAISLESGFAETVAWYRQHEWL